MKSNPVTVGPDASVSDAYDLMRKHHVRRLPVVEGEWLVGIVTLKDLWAAVASLEADADIFDTAFHMDRFTVLESMTHHVVTISPDASITTACDLMLRHEIGALPVVVEGRLVGILTESDIFRLVAQRWSENESIVGELAG
jgi:acetoin utilization protein AcuB